MHTRKLKFYIGGIEVICGSMFSGKTEELLRRVRRAQIAHLKIEIFKPKIDKRYHDTNIVSHDANEIKAIPINHSSEIIKYSGEAHVIGIDEAQFFDSELLNVCSQLANLGKRIIIAGLDMDFTGKPFGVMPYLLAIADDVTKLQAVCMVCGNSAHFTYRKTNIQQQFLLGEKENYQALCRLCYNNQFRKEL